MRYNAVIVLCGTLLAAGASLPAQICNGTASFAVRPARIGADIGISKSITAYGVNVAAGRSTGLFAAIEGALVDEDSAVHTGMEVSLDGGWAINANAEKTLQFCPRLVYRHRSGPDFDFGLGKLENDINSYGLGASLGGIVNISRTIDLVPFAEGTLVASTLYSAIDSIATQRYDRNFLVVIGIGVVVKRTLTLQPSVSIPVHRGNDDQFFRNDETIFKFGAAIAFGPRQRAR